MRCKICLKTFRSPPKNMRENQICAMCQKKMKKHKSNDLHVFTHYNNPQTNNKENRITQFRNSHIVNEIENAGNEDNNTKKSPYKILIEEDEREIEQLKIIARDIQPKIIVLNEHINRILHLKNELLNNITELQSKKNEITVNNQKSFFKKIINRSENKLITSLDKELKQKSMILGNYDNKLNQLQNELNIIIQTYDSYQIEIKDLEEQITKNKFRLINQETDGLKESEQEPNFDESKLEKTDISEEKTIEIEDCVVRIIAQNEKEKFHNLEIKEKMTDLYFEMQSIKKISESTNKPQNLVREYVRTPKRMPENLKKIYDENTLSSEPKLGLSIALYATDYFQWDGENDNQDKILELAIEIANFFKTNSGFRDKFLGLQTNLPKENNMESKTKKLEKLKMKYPYCNTTFNPQTDRSLLQYGILVSTRNLEIAEYVLKWEHDNKKRIPKSLASEILTDPIKFLNQNHKPD